MDSTGFNVSSLYFVDLQTSTWIYSLPPPLHTYTYTTITTHREERAREKRGGKEKCSKIVRQ